MAQIFRFRDFPVYKDARQFRKELKTLVRKSFPETEKYCLTSQLFRALDSVLLNIAEGSERYSDIDFSRFLNTALASVSEVVACLDAAVDDGYIDEGELKSFLVRAENILKQLKAFSAKVRKSAA